MGQGYVREELSRYIYSLVSVWLPSNLLSCAPCITPLKRTNGRALCCICCASTGPKACSFDGQLQLARASAGARPGSRMGSPFSYAENEAAAWRANQGSSCQPGGRSSVLSRRFGATGVNNYSALRYGIAG